MTAQTGQKVITIHILPNILRSKGNKTMKFGQLTTQHNLENILLEKPYTKCGDEASPKPFFKK